MRRKSLFLALMLLNVGACSSKNKPNSDDKPERPNPDIERLAKDNKAFALALALYEKVSAEPGNVFLSPYSISSALAMTYAGTRGQTKQEMAEAMRFRLEDERLHTAFGALGRQLRGARNGYALSVANGLFLQKDYPFLPEFLTTARDHYDASTETFDFRSESTKARQSINQWIEQKTRDRIKELIPEGTLTSSTRLVLVNAIHFKGDWASQFNKAHTRSLPFHVSRNETTPTPMMRQEGSFNYLHSDGVQVLEMSYTGKHLSMLVLLPDNGEGLNELERGLTAEKLAGWISRLKKSKVEIAFPKFKTTWFQELNVPLQRLGMKSAFGRDADLSGMTGRKELIVSNVLHKAFVDVNEEGTEAAAATVVAVKDKALPRTHRFTADHPFLYVIRDVRSGSILFLGRLAKP